jgi:hypothetical protein
MLTAPQPMPSEEPYGSLLHRRATRVWNALPFLSVIVCISYLYFSLGVGQVFNEDYAVYLQQAWNIAHHSPMNQMGVVQYFDPDLPLLFYSPLTYPPLLPVIYAVPVALLGFDLETFKVVQLVILGAGLFLFCLGMRKWRFDGLEISASVIVFVFSAEIRWSVNSIGSDLPFILFLMVALLAIDGFVKATDRKRRLWWGLLSGIAIVLAIDLRTVGVALLPAIFLTDVLAHRRIRFVALSIPLATTAAIWLGQWLMGWSSETYSTVLHYRFFTPIENIRQFYWALIEPAPGLPFAQLRGAILMLLAAAAMLGVLYKAVQGTAIALFIVSYTALLLVLPNFSAGARYLVPHLLVLGAFAVRGAGLVAQLINSSRRMRSLFASGTAALGMVAALLTPSPLPPGRWSFGVTSEPARQVFAFIRNETPDDALIATSKYRSFHLFTRRTTIRLPLFRSNAELVEWLHAHRVSDVVIRYSEPRSNYDPSDCPSQPLCNDTVPELQEIFRNSDFALFRVASGSG